MSVTTDPRLEQVRVERDGLDRPVVQRVDPDGLDLTTRTVYDGLGNPTSVTDPRGGLTRSTYDAFDGCWRRRTRWRRRTTYEYDGGGLKTRVTDRREVQRDFTYDNLGRPRTESIVPSISGIPWSHETRYEDVARRRLSLDALGRTTTQELDGLGRVVTRDGRGREVPAVHVRRRQQARRRRTSGRSTTSPRSRTTRSIGWWKRSIRRWKASQSRSPARPCTRTASNARVDTDRRGIATTTRMDPLGRTREVGSRGRAGRAAHLRRQRKPPDLAGRGRARDRVRVRRRESAGASDRWRGYRERDVRHVHTGRERERGRRARRSRGPRERAVLGQANVRRPEDRPETETDG